jgi:spectinomycin phosphotransferase
MDNKLKISDNSLLAAVQAEYGLSIAELTFLPLGADPDAVVYRARAENGESYFLKVKRGQFEEIGAVLTAFFQEQGMGSIIAPLPTKTGQLLATFGAFELMLYPFVEGQNGFKTKLSPEQWRTFGAVLSGIHRLRHPASLFERIPVEDYSLRWRETVRRYLRDGVSDSEGDPMVEELNTLLNSHRELIERLIMQSEKCALRLSQSSPDLVLCHTDIHAGNVLIAPDLRLYLVDWDAPRLAPKERDLMYIGCGIGDVWKEPEEAIWFYEGYGAVNVDPVALAYYRNERIVEDIAVSCVEILEARSNPSEYQWLLNLLAEMLAPDIVVQIAERTYQQIA